MDLDARLRATADRLGLAGFGVCDASPFVETRAAIDEARRSGRAAGLRFTLTESASTDVGMSFPWARRLVVGAWSYLDDSGSPAPAVAGLGRVARFATEDHYRELRSRLGVLANILAGEGYRTEILVDDNRLVDRAAAVRAGIGWWGKNTMVLTPRSGPWLLLGSIATDAPLGASAPMVRDCGTCEACLPACPTGALVAPGVLDARLCLAYWAQATGAIPLPLRAAMGDRIYGCDDCLEACPPGHRALAAAGHGVAGRHDIVELLAMDDATLLARFGHFYIPKRQPRFLRRNALVALGNVGGSRPGAVAVAVAAGYLGHRDPLLRAHAAWALGALGGGTASAVLDHAADVERDRSVLEEIAEALDS
jgi:epoxyqueuosine reductase